MERLEELCDTYRQRALEGTQPLRTQAFEQRYKKEVNLIWVQPPWKKGGTSQRTEPTDSTAGTVWPAPPETCRGSMYTKYTNKKILPGEENPMSVCVPFSDDHARDPSSLIDEKVPSTLHTEDHFKASIHTDVVEQKTITTEEKTPER